MDRGGIKGQIFKTVEMLTCIKADRGSGEESSEKLLGEKETDYVRFWRKWQKWNPEHEWRNWPEGRKGPLLSYKTKERKQFGGVGAESCRELHSYGFYLFF